MNRAGNMIDQYEASAKGMVRLTHLHRCISIEVKMQLARFKIVRFHRF